MRLAMSLLGSTLPPWESRVDSGEGNDLFRRFYRCSGQVLVLLTDVTLGCEGKAQCDGSVDIGRSQGSAKLGRTYKHGARVRIELSKASISFCDLSAVANLRRRE